MSRSDVQWSAETIYPNGVMPHDVMNLDMNLVQNVKIWYTFSSVLIDDLVYEFVFRAESCNTPSLQLMNGSFALCQLLIHVASLLVPL